MIRCHLMDTLYMDFDSVDSTCVRFDVRISWHRKEFTYFFIARPLELEKSQISLAKKHHIYHAGVVICYGSCKFVCWPEPKEKKTEER